MKCTECRQTIPNKAEEWQGNNGGVVCQMCWEEECARSWWVNVAPFLPYGADCPHQHKEDGTCGHEKNTTPECHEDACPLVPTDVSRQTTDELLETLPNHLHLARNDKADVSDRWRVYNTHTQKYIEPGASTARELLVWVVCWFERTSLAIKSTPSDEPNVFLEGME